MGDPKLAFKQKKCMQAQLRACSLSKDGDTWKIKDTEESAVCNANYLKVYFAVAAADAFDECDSNSCADCSEVGSMRWAQSVGSPFPINTYSREVRENPKGGQG